MRFCLLFCAAFGAHRLAAAEPLDWPQADRTCRPWAYHWWMGSAVDRDNLAREFQRYRDGGLGGVHIVPIYGVRGAEPRFIQYLSPRWMEMLRFAVQQGERLDLGVDMTTGTGWCFGGPHIPVELGGRRRVVGGVAFPSGGQLPEDFRPDRTTIQLLVARGPEGQQRVITDHLRPDGTVDWEPSAEGCWLYVVGHRFSGRMVKRAAPGGAGPMINPFDAAAMKKYLEPFTRAFADPSAARPRAMYHDSFEYISDWSPDLPAQFARRRGYRLEEAIRALAGQGDPDRVARVRCDVSETLSDLVVDEVFPQWVAWCRERGIQTRNQAHGAPANWLDFYALADIPETEMFGHGGPDPLVSQFDEHIGGADRDPLIAKFASSAAHLAGKPLVSAETGTWLAEHFCETFEELKGEIDLLFLAGVNHVFYHGCVYSPDDAPWPGWLFYASTQMNPRNPLWREAPTLNAYVTRCQSLLRTGVPDNDVLLYWPIHDAWARGVGNMSVHNKAALQGPFGQAARLLWERGYAFDYVSDRLLDRLQVSHGALEAPGGARWQAVVVPTCHHMPHTTLARLLRFAEGGLPVVFQDQLPADVPGLGQLEDRRAAFRESLSGLHFAEPAAAVREARVAAGRVLVGDLAEALRLAHIPRETLVDRPGLRFLRRREKHGRLYFLVNHALEPLDGWLDLATTARSAGVLDPLTGRTGVARTRPAQQGRIQVHLRLEPGHSLFLRTFQQDQIPGPPWVCPAPGKALVQLDGPWHIQFLAGGPNLPKPVATRQLASWTTWRDRDPTLEAFAGTAQYTCRFDMDEPWCRSSAAERETLLLDLGEVRHVAHVRLNGTDLGASIMHPHRIELPGKLLRPTGNQLEIEVTNLAANRIRDLDRRKVPWKIFHDINIVSIRYQPFDASQWPVFESGLLGPVTIRRTQPESAVSLR